MNKIKTTTDTIYNEYIKKDITIVHISDIHFSKITKKKNLDKLVKYIKNINPNYIMITGDIIDSGEIMEDKLKIKELFSFLGNLGKLAKVLISLGNHDILCHDDYTFFDEANKIDNVHFLNDSSFHDEFLYVFGYTLPSEYYYNINKSESVEVLIKKLDECNKQLIKIPKDTCSVALIHSPIRLTNPEVVTRLKKFNLILCGHTHNGMVPDILKIFFRGNSGLVAPGKGLFPKIAKGKIVIPIDKHDVTIIINGAITKLSERSGKFFSRLNFAYNQSVNKIIIKKEGDKNE